MRIFHRLSVDKDHWERFQGVGVDLGESLNSVTMDASFVVLRITEADERWPGVMGLVKSLGILDIVETEFSEAELDEAPAVSFLSKSFSGYPEPSGDMTYRNVTYDLSRYCPTCGSGLRQKAPFRMTKEPRWGRRQTFQLHWVFDELFVKPEVWQTVFEPFGVGCLRVQSRLGKDFQSVVQIEITETVDLIVPGTVVQEFCATCGRVKYEALRRGFWPKPLRTDVPLFRSTQLFGFGHSASREMYASPEMYRAMKMANLNCRYWASA